MYDDSYPSLPLENKKIFLTMGFKGKKKKVYKFREFICLLGFEFF